jgi:4-amino-4-deoxy-L-arabinose transferase-like glycosyltransferase
MWLDRRPVLRLLMISLVVHACVLVAVQVRTGRVDGYAFSSLDSREYYGIAQNLIDHGTFSQDARAPLKPDTWRTPGYPLFLAPVMLILGKSPVTLVAVQQVLAIVNVLMLFQIAREFMGDRRATVGAVLCLCEPYHLLYSTWLMSTTLFVTLLMLTWYSWQRAVERHRWTWFACLGLSCSVLVLVRPVGALVPIVVLGGILWRTWRRHREMRSDSRARTSWPGTIVFAVTLVIPCGAWMLRNQAVAGHFALSDQGGVVLAYFKATEVVLWQQGRAADRYLETSLDPAKADLPHTVWDEIDARLRGRIDGLTDEQRAVLTWPNLAQGNKTSIDSFEISRALTRIGWSYLTDAPVSTATCYLVRCGSILTFPLNLALWPATGVEAGRLSRLLAFPYVLLCAAVLIRLVQRWPAYSDIFFPLMCTVALLLASTPQIDPRFRVPMIPMLIFVALLSRRATANVR